jgi:hypothetical protein
LAAEVSIDEVSTMRKLIRATVFGLTVAAAGIATSGCSDTTETKEQTTIKAPGGTATETRSIKVEKDGQNPPAAPSEKMP